MAIRGRVFDFSLVRVIRTLDGGPHTQPCIVVVRALHGRGRKRSINYDATENLIDSCGNQPHATLRIITAALRGRSLALSASHSSLPATLSLSATAYRRHYFVNRCSQEERSALRWPTSG